jgi:hypothetical protein
MTVAGYNQVANLVIDLRQLAFEKFAEVARASFFASGNVAFPLR